MIHYYRSLCFLVLSLSISLILSFAFLESKPQTGISSSKKSIFDDSPGTDDLFTTPVSPAPQKAPSKPSETDDIFSTPDLQPRKTSKQVITDSDDIFATPVAAPSAKAKEDDIFNTTSVKPSPKPADDDIFNSPSLKPPPARTPFTHNTEIEEEEEEEDIFKSAAESKPSRASQQNVIDNGAAGKDDSFQVLISDK